MRMQKIHPWLHNIFLLGGFLSLVSGIQLFVLAEYTEKYFAWTIQSFITAATFGGFYFSAIMYGFLSAGEVEWSKVRAPAVSLFVFTSLTLIASLIHVDKFHWSNSDWVARAAAYVWMLIYVLLPPLLAIAFVVQSRMSGNITKTADELPIGYKILLIAFGLMSASIGFILFFIPAVIIPFMPLELTPFTARVLSAWLFSFGAAGLLVWRENDRSRIRVFRMGNLTAGLAGLLAIFRYFDNFESNSLAGIFYLLYLVLMAIIGIFGFVQSRRRNSG